MHLSAQPPTSFGRYTQAALVADALCLGPHWLYQPLKIARLYPNGVYQFTDPMSQYHPNRHAGEQTHYGDQLLWLAQLLGSQSLLSSQPNTVSSQSNHFNLIEWRSVWLQKMSIYNGYLDQASKQALINQGQGSDSQDLAGIARLAALLDLAQPLQQTIDDAKAEVAISHESQVLGELAEFVVRTCYALQENQGFEDALRLACYDGDYPHLAIASLDLEDLFTTANSNTPIAEIAEQFGIACSQQQALPLTLALAVKFSRNFYACLNENALLGGDSAARGIMLALLFCARDGEIAAPLFAQLACQQLAAQEESTVTNTNSTSSTKTNSASLDPRALRSSSQGSIWCAGAHTVKIPSRFGQLAGLLQIPQPNHQRHAYHQQHPLPMLIFAHSFDKPDYFPEQFICEALAEQGIGSLRLDFSTAEHHQFSPQTFLSHLQDLKLAYQWLVEQGLPAQTLIGHSLAGTACLAAAASLTGIKQLVTIGAPFEPQLILKLFEEYLPQVKQQGQAEILIDGRPFVLDYQFVSDIEDFSQSEQLKSLYQIKSLLFHGTDDQQVPLAQSRFIYNALPQPKSFMVLDGADHMLSDKKFAAYIAGVVQLWL